MNANPSPESFSLSPALGLDQLEQLYYGIVLNQDFYDSDYGSDWNPEPYENMAKVLQIVFAPHKHVDVGCGKGFLVAAMRRLGVISFGVDYSTALVNQAPTEVKPFLQIGKTEDWITNSVFQGVDLITYMEVFEHLPPSISREILRSLRESFVGNIFLTTPSYGIDARLQLGIRTNASTPDWQSDMARNAPFRNIVLQNGMPHHGHITLGSYKWWTEFFLCYGWVRSRDCEAKQFNLFRPVLMKYNWNPYVLEPMPADCLDINLTSHAPLGSGWHEAEEAGRWTNGRGEFYLYCHLAALQKLVVELAAPNINVIKDYSVLFVVEQQTQTPSYELSWRPYFVSNLLPLAKREAKDLVEIDLTGRVKASRKIDNSHSLFRGTLLTPTFRPKEYGLSNDERTLGVFCSRLTVTG